MLEYNSINCCYMVVFFTVIIFVLRGGFYEVDC